MWLFRTFSAYKRQTRYLTTVAIISVLTYKIFIAKGGVFHDKKLSFNRNSTLTMVYPAKTRDAIFNKDNKKQSNGSANTLHQNKRSDDKTQRDKDRKKIDIFQISDITKGKVQGVGRSFNSFVSNKSLSGSDTKVKILNISNRLIKVNPNVVIRVLKHKDKSELLKDQQISIDEYFDHFDLHLDRPYYPEGIRTEDDIFKQEYVKMSDYWKIVADGIGVNGKLFKNSFDVDDVLSKLQTSKILNISFFLNRPTLKWVLTLEGEQKVLFKPELNAKEKQHCKFGCEHPKYEIGGFAINRMLGLNSMPFTTGRTLDWFTEIEPIANNEFKRLFTVYYKYKGHSKVCVKWRCIGTFPEVYCFQDSRIYGSIMYMVNGDIVELRQYSFHKKRYSRYHPMHFSGTVNKKSEMLGVGDTRLCDKVRQKPPYDNLYHFMYILDMAVEDFLTQSWNSKHNILYLDSTNTTEVDVFIDKGKGFCPYENDLLLAPVYQCCMIRKSVFEALEKLEHRFQTSFKQTISLEGNVFTKDQLEGIEARITIILDYVKKCFELKGRDNVLKEK